MYDEIWADRRVQDAVDDLPSPSIRGRARGALLRVLNEINAASVDRVVAELADGPRRAPAWQSSRAELLTREARRRAVIGDPVWPVFESAAAVAADLGV